MGFSSTICLIDFVRLTQPPFEARLAHLELLDDSPHFSESTAVALKRRLLRLVLRDDVEILQYVRVFESG